MQEIFSSISLRNSKILCVGSITRREAKEAASRGIEAEPTGFYLYLASAEEPTSPIEILAKFFSVEQAERAAELFPAHA